MRAPSPVWLFLLCGATAAAHEKPFRAFWVQPLAPLATHYLIVPVGLTEGLGSGIDLSLEVTSYAGLPPPQVILPDADTGSGCGGPCTGIGMHGLIATTGVAFGASFLSNVDWEIGVFLGPKALMAVATEPGAPNGIFGVSYEIGAGLDAGIELHARRFGLYAALVLGLQTTTVFGSGNFIVPATWPVLVGSNASLFAQSGALRTAASLNLLRVGWVF